MVTNMLSTVLVSLALIHYGQATHELDAGADVGKGNSPLTFNFVEGDVVKTNENDQLITDVHDQSEEHKLQAAQEDSEKLLIWYTSNEDNPPPKDDLRVLKVPVDVSAYEDGSLTPEQAQRARQAVMDAAVRATLSIAGRLPKSEEETRKVLEIRQQLVASDEQALVSGGGGRRRRRKKRSIKNYPSYKWKNGIIPGVFSPSLTLTDRDGVRQGASLIEYYSCVNVVDYKKNVTRIQYKLDDEGYVNFTKSSGCWATIGARHSPLGQQTACCDGYTCAHEIGHTLGLIHDHQDAFRDFIVNIEWENIQPNYRQWYEVEPPPVNSDNKDIGSIMSYGNWAFGISGAGATMTEFEDYVRFGRTTYTFFKDINEFVECINEERCPGFNKDCGEHGFPAYVNGKCTCHCLDGLDPEMGCASIRTNFSGTASKCWPNGDYAIPMPKTGCPGDNEFDVATYIQRGESGMWVYSVYNLGWVYPNYLERKMCVRKNTADTPKCDLKWRPGQYGIYRVGEHCPEGFHQAFAVFADNTAQESNSYEGPKIAGELPSANGSETRIEYCVRNDGVPTVPTNLPNDKPFVLYRIDHAHECPLVEGMYGMKEWYSFNSENRTVFGRSPNFYSANEGNYKALGSTWSDKMFYIYYCYYKPMAYGGFVKHLDDSTRSVEITSPGYPNGYPNLVTYTWLVTSPPDTTIIIKVNFMDVHFLSTCKDFIELRLGEPYEAPQIFCGTSGQSGLLGNLVAKGNRLHIRFKTDPVQTRPGFNFTVSYIENKGLRYLTSDHGASYRGSRNYTIDYKPCVRWDQVSSHCSYGLFHMSGDDRGLEKNYCRNPSDTGHRPWCYTSKETCARRSCDVGNLAGVRDTLTDCKARRALGECLTSPEEIGLTGCAYTCHDLLPREEIPPPVSSVSCDAPEAPKDGILVEADLKESYKVGNKVRVRCRIGRDEAVMTCTTDGQWSRLGYVCGGCSEDEVYYAVNRTVDVPGLCYRFVNSRMKFQDAQTYCQSHLGGQLADFSSAFVTEIYRSARKGMQRVMVGITYNSAKEIWENMDGSPANNVPWDLAEQGSGTCAFYTGEDKVRKSSCYSAWPFVCSRTASERELCRDRYPHCNDLLLHQPDFCTLHADGPARVLCPWTCGVCSSKTHFEPCTSDANCSSRFACNAEHKICLCPEGHIWKAGACVPTSEVLPTIEVDVVDTTTVNVDFCDKDHWIKSYDVVVASPANPSVLSSSLTSCRLVITGLQAATAYSFSLTAHFYYYVSNTEQAPVVPFRTKALLNQECAQDSDCADTDSECREGICLCPDSFVWIERDRVCRAFCPDLYYRHETECATMAANGDCVSNINWMKTYCAATCNICPTSCDDKMSEDACLPRVYSGDCVKSLTNMTSSCPRSCNLCPNDCNNKLSDSECQTRLTNGECTSNAAFMRTNCPRACSLCPGYGEACTENTDCNDYGTVCLEGRCQCADNTAWKDGKCRLTECTDTHHNCPYYASVGYCPSDGFVISHCRKSCGRCGTFDDVCATDDDCGAAGTLCSGGRCLCPDGLIWNTTACVPGDGAVPKITEIKVTDTSISVDCTLSDPAYAFLVEDYTLTLTSGSDFMRQYQSSSCSFLVPGLDSNRAYSVEVESSLKYLGGEMESAPVELRTRVGLGDACTSDDSCFEEGVYCSASSVCACQEYFHYVGGHCLSAAGATPVVEVSDVKDKSITVTCSLPEASFEDEVTEYKLRIWSGDSEKVETSTTCSFSRSDLEPATVYNVTVTATLGGLGAQATSPASLIRTESCADHNESCASWKNDNDCENRPDFMAIHCRKSCNLCGTAAIGEACTSGSDCESSWADCGSDSLCYCLEGHLPKEEGCVSDVYAVPVLRVEQVSDRQMEVTCSLPEPLLEPLVASYRATFTSDSSASPIVLTSTSCSFTPQDLRSDTLYSVTVEADFGDLNHKAVSLPLEQRTKAGLGDTCNDDKDCSGEGLQCDANFLCTCGAGFFREDRHCFSDEGAKPVVTVIKLNDVSIDLSCSLNNASFASLVTGYTLTLGDGSTTEQYESDSCSFSVGLSPGTSYSLVVEAVLSGSGKHKASDVLSFRTATCMDYSTSCSAWAGEGKCAVDADTKANCRLTCNICGNSAHGETCTGNSDCRGDHIECAEDSNCACIEGFFPNQNECISGEDAKPIVTVSQVTDRSMEITCSQPAPSFASFVTSYTANLTTGDGSFKQFVSSDCSFTPSDLDSNTDYTIAVELITNYYGRRLASEPTTARTGSSLTGACTTTADCFPEHSSCQTNSCICTQGFLPSGRDCVSDQGAVPVITVGEVTERSIQVSCVLANDSFASFVTSYSVSYDDGAKQTVVTSETCAFNPTTLTRFTPYSITVTANLNYHGRHTVSAVTVQKTGTCSNFQASCESWRQQGYCVHTYVEYMKGNCRNSCEYCGKYNEECVVDADCTAQGTECLQEKCVCHPNNHWNGTGCYSGYQGFCTQDVQCTFPGAQCINNTCDCPTDHVWLDSECQLGRCTNKQSDESCNGWEASGYCTQTYVAFMMDNCKKACVHCGGYLDACLGEEDCGAKGSTCTENRCTCPSGTTWDGTACSSAYQAGCLDDAHCSNHAGVCRSNTCQCDAENAFWDGTNCVYARCINKDENCQQWKNQGECNKTRAFMENNCPLACQFCGGYQEKCMVDSDCWPQQSVCADNKCQCPSTFQWNGTECQPDSDFAPVLAVGSVTDHSIEVTCTLANQSYAQLVDSYSATYSSASGSETLTSSTCSFEPSDLSSNTEYTVVVSAALSSGGATYASTPVTQSTASRLEEPCSAEVSCYGSHVVCHASNVCICSEGHLPQHGRCMPDSGATPVVTVGEVTDNSMAFTCALANDSFVSMVTGYTATLALTSGPVLTLTSTACSFQPDGLDSGSNYTVTVKATLNYFSRTTSSAPVHVRTKDCVNSDTLCEYWKERGYCGTNEWMTSADGCRRACGMCKDDCDTEKGSCAAFGDEGHCQGAEYKDWMWEYCRLTCDVCGGYGESCKYDSGCTAPGSVCQDGVCTCPPGTQWTDSQCQTVGCEDVWTEDCPSLASEGFCVRTPRYMEKFCRKSCNFCPDDCQDVEGADCQARAGECGSAYTQENCKHTCQSCPGHGDHCNTHQDCSVVGTVCKDGSCQCADSTHWQNGKCIPACSDTTMSCVADASDGKCTTDPQYMLVNCRLSCEACGELGNLCLDTLECTANGTECIDFHCSCPSSQVWFNDACVSDAGAIPSMAVGTVTENSISVTCELTNAAFAAVVTSYTATASDGASSETLTSSTCNFDLKELKSNTNYSVTVGAVLNNGAVKSDWNPSIKTKSVHGEACQGSADCAGDPLQCRDASLCVCKPGLVYRASACVSAEGAKPEVSVLDWTSSTIALSCSLADPSFSDLVTSYTVKYTDSGTPQAMTSPTCNFVLPDLRSNTAYVIEVSANLNYYETFVMSSPVTQRTASKLAEPCTQAIGCHGNEVECDASSSMCACKLDYLPSQGECIADTGVTPVISVAAVTDHSISVTCSPSDTSSADYVTSYTAIYDDGVSNKTMTSSSCSFSPSTLKSNTEYTVTVVATLNYMGRKKFSAPATQRTASSLSESCTASGCYGDHVVCHSTSVCVCDEGYLRSQGTCVPDAEGKPEISVDDVTVSAISISCQLANPALSDLVQNYTATFHDGVNPRTLTSDTCSFTRDGLDSSTDYSITVRAHFPLDRETVSATKVQRTDSELGGTCVSTTNCEGDHVACHEDNVCICSLSYLPKQGLCVSEEAAAPVITVADVTETSMTITCELADASLASLVSSYTATLHNGTSETSLTSPSCTFQPEGLLGGVQYAITVTPKLDYYGRSAPFATVNQATTSVLGKACNPQAGCLGVNVECHTSKMCVCAIDFIPLDGSCVSDSGLKPLVSAAVVNDRTIDVSCTLTDPSLESMVKEYSVAFLADDDSFVTVTSPECSFSPLTLRSMTYYTIDVAAVLTYLGRTKVSDPVTARTTACSDYDQNCEGWSKSYDCSPTASVGIYCRKSCGHCGTYNEPCVEEDDCGAVGTECLEERCLCPSGVTWNGASCFAGFGEFCTKDDQCVTGARCISGECACSEGYIWTGASCAYGVCEDTDDNCPGWGGWCGRNAYVDQNCKKTCKTCGGYEAYCIGDSDCSIKGGICLDNQCRCPSMVAWNGTDCVAELGRACLTDDNCATVGAKCIDGTCSCPSDHVFDGDKCKYGVCMDKDDRCSWWPSYCGNNYYVDTNCIRLCKTCGEYNDVCISSFDCVATGTQCLGNFCKCPEDEEWDGSQCVPAAATRKKRDTSLVSNGAGSEEGQQQVEEEHEYCVVPTLDPSWGVRLDNSLGTVWVEGGVPKVKAGHSVHYVCTLVTNEAYTGNLIRPCSRRTGRLMGRQAKCRDPILGSTMLNDVELVKRPWVGVEGMAYVGNKNTMFHRDGCLKKILYYNTDRRYLIFQIWVQKTDTEGRRFILKKQWKVLTDAAEGKRTFEIEGGYNVRAGEMLGVWYGSESKRGGIPFTDCSHKLADTEVDYERDDRVWRLKLNDPLRIPSNVMMNALSDPMCLRFSLNAVIDPPCPVVPPPEEMEDVEDVGLD